MAAYNDKDIERAVRLIKAGYMTINDIVDTTFKTVVQTAMS